MLLATATHLSKARRLYTVCCSGLTIRVWNPNARCDVQCLWSY